MTNTQHLFSGSIPENYDKYLGPLILAEYAADLAHRLTLPAGGCMLETVTDTGIATRSHGDCASTTYSNTRCPAASWARIRSSRAAGTSICRSWGNFSRCSCGRK